MATLLLTSAVKAMNLKGFWALAANAAATAAGSYIDQKLINAGKSVNQLGARLESLAITGSSEGGFIPRFYGRMRLGGNIFWGTYLQEEAKTEKVQGGGKGGGGGGASTKTTTFSYYGNFAVGFCEGIVDSVTRLWFDGKEVDLQSINYRFYKGTESQLPDSLMETKEGTGNNPAYRGLCYIVFEKLPLGEYGNRIPQVTAELHKATANASPENLIKGVNLIPGCTEFGYDPEIVSQFYSMSGGQDSLKTYDNKSTAQDASDWEVSLDQLANVLPEVKTVCFVVAWFGDDLRAQNCTIRPKVENNTKSTMPYQWKVSTLDRTTALVISQSNGSPAYGGAANDYSVFKAIQDLKARGYKVLFYPFILMDIPAGNTLPNPYSPNSSATGQPAYPWRGRITCSPAPSFAGTVDKTSAAGTQIASFVGSCTASNFYWNIDHVHYTGPNEWSFRRMILHYATLCAAAGGVDYFCVGTEMVGLTQVRSSAGAGTYPFVEALRTLSTDVSNVLPTAKIGYAADWSEYHSHRPSDGTGDVIFNMDRLWSHSDIDFIGIDNYLPMSDWRDGDTHLDRVAGWKSIYDLDYLKANINGGEFKDWYYSSFENRVLQNRTPISDVAHNEPWIYGNKAIKEWWLNSHRNRPGGIRDSAATSWVPQSKPIFFTEFGCGAMDKSTNQPNIFVDPKSSESYYPYFSNGGRDDVIQRQAIRATYEYWNDNANNPISTIYGSNMVDKNNIYIWAWDARPAPSFPQDSSRWADADNWRLGHWLNGRSGSAFIPAVMDDLAEYYGFNERDFSRAYGVCDGFIVSDLGSFRDAVEPLELAFFFDVIESGSAIKAISKVEAESVKAIDLDLFADAGEGNDYVTLTRAQPIELPKTAKVSFINSENEYQQASVEATRATVQSEVIATASLPIAIDSARAQEIADKWLYDTWAAREKAVFGVLPSEIEIEPGDVLILPIGEYNYRFRVATVSDGAFRQIEAYSFDRNIYEGSQAAPRLNAKAIRDTGLSGVVSVAFMDLPALADLTSAHKGYVAATAALWPGGVDIFSAPADAGYGLNIQIEAPATMGYTVTDLYPGPTHVIDENTFLWVEMIRGQLSTISEIEFLNYGNPLAIQAGENLWEIVQFRNAELVGPNKYKLSGFIRGLLGTEDAMLNPIPAGAKVVLLNSAVNQINMTQSDVGQSKYFKYGPSNKPISDDSFQSLQFAFKGRGLKPYSVCHIKAVEAVNNDIELTWVRRARLGTDSWDIEVPLNEESEAYEIDVKNGNTVVRTISTNSASCQYSSALQSSDFGSLPSQIDFTIYQIAAGYGRGTPRSFSFYR